MTRLDGTNPPPLSTEEAKTLVIDEVAKICPTGSIAFSGGEFLLRPDALDLLAHAAGRGLYAFVNTNGSILDSGLVGEIKKAAQGRVSFGFSLDSVDAGVQRSCRSGSREEFLDRASLCDDAGLGYFVLVTVSRANLATLDETMAFFRKRHIPVIRSPFVPRGAAASLRDLMFTREEMEEIIHPVLRGNHLDYVSFTPFFASPDATRIGLKSLGLSLGQLGCQAARGFLAVSSEGDVAPCVHLLDSEAVCGNVKETPLAELFRKHPVLTALREGRGLKGKCGRCRYRTSCGGCRALAFYSTGDCFAEDPTCFFEPASEEDRSPHEEEIGRNTKAFIEFVATQKPWRDVFAGSLSGKIGAHLLRSALKIRDALSPPSSAKES
jgi:radical SAM protein with 4Fe4S-binding SPASM domain